MKQLKDFDAVIYDMDGVLIDSEPLWKIAMEEAFHAVGCMITKKDFEQTVGMRIDQVVAYWYQQRPWPQGDAKSVENEIIRRMGELIRANGEPLPGVRESLAYFKAAGLKIGLATSSYTMLIDAVLDVLQLTSYFDLTHSAEHERYGKPHPAVYLHTAQELGVDPRRCLVIEDSINGVIAGKAAGMFVLCVPEKTHEPSPKLAVADLLFEDLNLFLDALRQQ